MPRGKGHFKRQISDMLSLYLILILWLAADERRTWSIGMCCTAQASAAALIPRIPSIALQS